MVTTILIVLVILIVGGGYAALRYTRSQYYVGSDGKQVIIYRGINQKRGRIDLSSVLHQDRDPAVPGPRDRQSRS